MPDAYICGYSRTPIGRFGGALSSVRADDLGALPIKALMAAHEGLSKPESDALNARLILVLANHIGDRAVLRAALDAAKSARPAG